MSPLANDVLGLLSNPALIAVTDKHHGLGNRIRAVLGARILARAEGRAFAYTWPVGKAFGAAFSELWDFQEPLVSTAISRLVSPCFPYKDNKLLWLNAAARAQRVWQIRTAHALLLPPDCTPWEQELRALSPAEAVRSSIQSAFAEGPSGVPFIGVMIRTNSNAHQETLKHSPLEWYLHRMGEIRQWWPEVPFYVSADTPEAFTEVQKHFPHTHGNANKGPYNSKQALSSSVVDVYMLAAATHVLGPHYSSFPELAQRLAGPELRLETSQTPTATRLTDRTGLSTPADPLVPYVRSRLG